MKAHRIEIRRKDREFQRSIPLGARCIVREHGKVGGCFGQLTKHHVVRRRHLASRWDDANVWITCCRHHSELHTIGDKAFCAKYGIPHEGREPKLPA